MHTTRLPRALLVTVVAACAAASASAQLDLLGQFNANQPGGFSAGEILGYDSAADELYVTSSGSGVHRINVFGIDAAAQASAARTIDFSAAFGAPADMLGLSSVAIDPLGRFGVAALIPAANTTTLGKVGFFELGTGNIVGTLDVGYHPDSVLFSADGSRLIVVNEGETNPTSSTNAPGSISILDTGAILGSNLSALTSLTVATRDFSAAHLASGVSIAGLRDHNHSGIGVSGPFIGTVPARGSATAEVIEPEYATIRDNKVYVTLQENNAIGVFDLGADKWVEVKDLGTIQQTVDGSDQDGGIQINDTVAGLPMPDTIASYSAGGKTYLVTANEGDARVDDRDVSRFGAVSGNGNMNPILDPSLPADQTGSRANTELGRLNISRLDGDTNADGLIDTPVMLGTRSFSIHEQTPSGLVRVYDSGSFFETYISENFSGQWQDGRSDDKGPEPEGLTVVTIAGRTYLFIGMERTGHVFMFDVTNPEAPVFMDAEFVAGALRPEGFLFVEGMSNPTGQGLLFVGFEGDGSNPSTEQIAVFSVTPSAIPEPASIAALAGLGVLGGAALRRRRRA